MKKSDPYLWGCTRIFLVLVTAVVVFVLATVLLAAPLDSGGTAGDQAWNEIKMALAPMTPAQQWLWFGAFCACCVLAGWGLGGMFRTPEEI